MKYSAGFFAVLLVVVCVFPAQAAKARAQEQATGAAQKSKSGKTQKSNPGASPFEAAQDPELDSVLSKMDASAATFRSAEADLAADQYEKVVDETTPQSGKIYFRRKEKGLQMAIAMTSPDEKYVLLTDNKIRLYQPKIEQVTEYALGKNRSEVESMFALGFGGRGHDLLKSFDVKLDGFEVIDGVKTSKLELTPKPGKLKDMFSRIELWVDPSRGISLRQQFWEPSGSYRLARYSNIKLNQKLADDVFKLKTTSHTKTVTP
jgi:outer membrane lipoprotein-sorting protein